MVKRHTYESVREFFDSRGHELISKEYKNTNEKLKFRCPSHPDKINEIRFSDYRKGHGCKHCGIERRSAIKRIPFEQVRGLFTERGYELLEGEYTNASTPLKYKCPRHPDKQLKITYSSLRKGAGCKYCAGLAKPSIEEVRAAFSERGYTLVSDKYVNSSTKMIYLCDIHPDKINEINYANFKNLTQGCPHCAGSVKYTLDEVRAVFESAGYELLESEYKSNHTKMRFKCPNHFNKETKISLKEINRGGGCRYCYLEFNRGENHPAYNHELTDEERERRRFYPEYYEFRRGVFERDQYTCTECGDSTGGNLAAHHIDGYDWCKEKRTDISNGVTLCEDCHKDFHEGYGYGGNTREQFIKWSQIMAKEGEPV